MDIFLIQFKILIINKKKASQIYDLEYFCIAVKHAKIAKNLLYASWIAAILYLFLIFVIHPDTFSPENISYYIQTYSHHLWITYILCSMIRGFFLMPSTPFVLSGLVLFPNHKSEVLFISLLGVLFSSTLLYYYSDTLGFSRYLEHKFPNQIPKIKKILMGKWSFLYILIWSIFPAVPTDTVAYAGGIIKMKYGKLILGILLGEFILIATYVYLGEMIVEKMSKFFEFYKF